ncbi:MAG: HAMP domain-containing protein, partial [Pedobacter sp.]
MKIKTKLRLGFGFLFLVVLVFGGMSMYFMNRISESSKVVLKDNYKSLKFSGRMRELLEEYPVPLSEKAAKEFAFQLNLETQNITEPGEGKAVEMLKVAFGRLADPKVSKVVLEQSLRNARQLLRSIDDTNMNAIVRKNDRAQHGVEEAATYLIFAATVCFLILFSFVINFPGFVANPLREFSAALKEISRKNYKQRLEFSGSDEFSDLATEFNAMSTQLNNWENSNLAKIQSEKLRIETIIEQMHDAIIGLNEKKEVLFLNRVAGQLLNLSDQDSVGKNTAELVKRSDLLKTIMEYKLGSKPLKIYADDKESYFQLERREIMVPNNEDVEGAAVSRTARAAGEVYILRNITEFKELDEAKTNFIATVSHELKTPISSIKMSLKLMDDERVGAMNPEQKELVQHIKDDCGRLLKITSELLDLAQVETGKLQLNFVKTDPTKIAIYAMDSVRFQAEQKSISLELLAKPGISKVNLDSEKTAWVLVNFLSNAMRYSGEKSKIVIQIAEKENEVEFSVQDFGKGIDEQYQQRLFD